MYLPGTENVYSYLEARAGAEYDETVFFGLQGILMRYMQGAGVVDPWYIADAKDICDAHMGPGIYNEEGWYHIWRTFGGKLPVEIWAVPEGSVHKPGSVLMTVVNQGGEKTAFLTSYLETLLEQVWYPTTVATRSRSVKKLLADYLLITTGSVDGIDFGLHDFGCRGATGMDAAAIGGLGHLVSFKGTDTVPALWQGKEIYKADLSNLGFSVAAAEHSIMTQLGREGEADVVAHLLKEFPSGILAAPIDSYDYVNYVTNIAGKQHKETIMNRDGKFVFRPDSVSPQHPTPESEMVWLANTLYEIFGGTVNEYGYKVLDPHVGMLWGDGITEEGIKKILDALLENEFATSNVVFGMGGGLLQKLNRDTQRFAYKASAQYRNGEWVDIKKEPLDRSKASKAGRFDPEEYGLELVFDGGQLVRWQNFDDVRENAKL
jgi:nicotinamide phosphoribosyltransferase